MPELPDVTVYVEALQRFIVGKRLEAIRLASPFLLRTVEPPLAQALGQTLRGIQRVGKRIVWVFDDDLFLVFHLMIAGRFHWKKAGAALHRKTGLASFDFAHGSLFLSEASPKKRASLHVVSGKEALAALDAGGVEPLEAPFEAFDQALRRENHTLKRALTDPALVAGIGNAYSDEILHRARLSPVLLTNRTTKEEMRTLYEAAQATLKEWIVRLRIETGEGFPEKVTAFRPEMAVHGRFGQPCPRCGSPVQRIVRAENETNYCATCQTGGKLLADRALSRLLGENWPRSFEELEQQRTRLLGG